MLVLLALRFIKLLGRENGAVACNVKPTAIFPAEDGCALFLLPVGATLDEEILPGTGKVNLAARAPNSQTQKFFQSPEPNCGRFSLYRVKARSGLRQPSGDAIGQLEGGNDHENGHQTKSD